MYRNWDNGEVLTPEEHASIMTLGSDYERYRAINIHTRDCEMVKEGLLTEVGPIIPRDVGAVAPQPPKRKSRPKPRAKVPAPVNMRQT